ncbi:uncharacterized protein LOC130743770 [Lotus japonicus]|uniref:uncharacterized protein LOC130743770 n=1 Tax=Lotus japonicus TaxID=34305 RepID=UPI00258FDFE8|nr:uncharacterized protein LOC130743770 [Lotus japonicus]
MAILLRLRRTHPFLLQFRLLSTSNSSGDGPNSSSVNSKQASLNTNFQSHVQFERKWKLLTLSLLSFRDRYVNERQFLSEMIKSRQAFLNETIENLSVLSALPSYPILLPPTRQMQMNLGEKLINSNRLDRLISLKEMLVEVDEMLAELSNSRLTFLQEIINSFLVPRPLINDEGPLRKKRDELNERLMRLRVSETRFNSSNHTLLLLTVKFFFKPLKVLNMVMLMKEILTMKEDELSAALSNSGLTKLQVIEIMKDLFEEEMRPRLRQTSSVDEGWRKKWNELNEMWNVYNERGNRLREMEKLKSKYPTSKPPRKILCGRRKTFYWFQETLCERLKTINSHLRLKEMLVKEDKLSTALTFSSLTSLQEIINNFSDIDEGPPRNELNERWNELNKGLVRLREMEVEDAELIAVRTNGELDFVFQKKLFKRRRWKKLN